MTNQTLAILAAMLSDPARPWYGLELVDDSGLKSGTIYPALARLERAGWLASRWETVDPHAAGRPRRRLYELTGTGIEHARHEIDKQLRTLRPAARLPGGPQGVPA